MELHFAPRDILQIDDARLVYCNFSGEASKFNRKGDRNFSVVIETPEMADALIERGWNVKIKPPRVEGGTPSMHLPVKIKFNERGPRVYLKSSGPKPVELDEESIDCLDNIDILSVDLDIRPYDWTLDSGLSGRTAYLQSIHVTQRIDRFAARYEEDYE